MTALIILNEEMDNIMKIVKSFEESGLLIKGSSESMKNEAKEQNGVFSGMLLGAMAASLLRSVLAGKPKIPERGLIRVGKGLIQAGEGTIREVQAF